MIGARVSPRRAFWGTLVAILLLQAAWVLVVPVFRGIDEFDHVYRASAVAHGQLIATQPAPDGRGDLVTVPGTLVRAATPGCTSRIYTLHDNCYPESSVGHGMVRVASAAAAYNPSYYAVVGLISKPFHGEGVAYAMRITTAVLSALLIAWAASLTARWARSGWPMLAFPVIATPVFVYSTMVASPNGIEYAASVLFWCSLLALSEEHDRREPLLLPLTVAAVAMICTHTSGMIWIALIVLAMAPLLPLGEWWAAARARPRAWLWSSAAVIGSALACIAWILSQHTNALSPPQSDVPPLSAHILLRGEMLWIMQSIAAFPMRDDPGPLAVYAIWCGALALTAGLFLRGASRREHLAMALLATFFVAVPAGLTMVSFSHEGLAWQGRYALPLGVGFGLMAARSLERRRVSLAGPVVKGTMLVTTLGSAACVAKVHLEEFHHFGGPSWADHVPGGGLLAVLLCLAAYAAWLVIMPSARTPHGRGHTSAPSHAKVTADGVDEQDLVPHG